MTALKKVYTVIFSVLVLQLAAINLFAQSKPNVIFIYADDVGYGDLSCYGAEKIQTPELDKLAANGLRFTNGHSTSASCTPSRFALMTGEYPWRKHGRGILPGDAALIVPVNKITLPKVFKNAGYQTGIVGKWHLGLGDSVKKNWNEEIKPGPRETGFDYSYIFPATADRVPTVFMENQSVVGLNKNDTILVDYKKKIGNEPTGKENPELLKLHSSVGHNNTIVNGIGRIGFMSGGKQARWTDEEIGPVFLSKAKDFIEQNAKQPFFLFYALNDIHVPRMPSTMFKGKSQLGARGDAILQMDWAVGEIVKQLKRLNLYDNTIIIFSSDNGPVLDDGYKDEAVEKNNGHKPAGVLRGWKMDVYEGGNRVPFIVHWNKKIKPGVSDALISQMDLLQSFAFFHKIKINTNEATDSKNMWGALTGTDKKGRTTYVVEGYENLAIIREGWKYIPAFRKEKEQLYYLTDDLSEKNNLAETRPDKVKQLQQLLEKIKEEQK